MKYLPNLLIVIGVCMGALGASGFSSGRLKSISRAAEIAAALVPNFCDSPAWVNRWSPVCLSR